MSHHELKRSSSVGDKRQWVRPDLPSKCTWHLGVKSDSPSSQQDRVSDGTTLVRQDQLRRLMKN